MVSCKVRFFFLKLSFLFSSSSFLCLYSSDLVFFFLASFDFVFAELKEVVDLNFTLAKKLNYVSHIFLLNVSFFEHSQQTAIYSIDLVLSCASVIKILRKSICLTFLLSTSYMVGTLFLTTSSVLWVEATVAHEELLLILESLFGHQKRVDIDLLFFNFLFHFFKLYSRPYLLLF